MNTGDFREELEKAVAFRLTEREEVSASRAREMVRDFAVYGLQSKYHSQVLAAAYDLFKPLLAAAVPFLRAGLQQAVVEIQTQNARGEVAEANHEA